MRMNYHWFCYCWYTTDMATSGILSVFLDANSPDECNQILKHILKILSFSNPNINCTKCFVDSLFKLFLFQWIQYRWRWEGKYCIVFWKLLFWYWACWKFIFTCRDIMFPGCPSVLPSACLPVTLCGYHKKLWVFNKLSCMYCDVHMMFSCTSYFVLTLTYI